MTPDDLLPHIPYLRRYARLLTGEQSAGDSIVAAMLERLLDNSSLKRKGSVRTSLYSSLSTVLAEHRAARLTCHSSLGEIDKRLMAMSPLAREVFLLVTVEQFSLAEVADILDITPAEVGHRLEQAGDDIARQMATNVLIIEDEPLIALAIENIVLDMGHAVTGIASTKKEALAIFDREKPGLILADIQLADGSSGLEAVGQILASKNTPAIFITAFPERVLTGTTIEPAFLIAKPFQPAEVRAVVSQTLFFRRDQT